MKNLLSSDLTGFVGRRYKCSGVIEHRVIPQILGDMRKGVRDRGFHNLTPKICTLPACRLADVVESPVCPGNSEPGGA